ncbi:hypothetical protein OG373_39025 [Streptomyces avidinii]|uniref:hypothetical protein n=1 Tax=Streptomyces avidinii TaxID=1895 RepID=UPI00386781E8|nr:hypothetical protein OG373_39025 [Streptomyces avidinii]
MSFVKQETEESQEQELEPGPRPSGWVPLVLGAAAVAMIGCPFLPDGLPAWLRFAPVYFVIPVGILAVVFGLLDLRHMRGPQDDGGAARRRARTGAVLGTVATMLPLVVVWFASALLGG